MARRYGPVSVRSPWHSSSLGGDLVHSGATYRYRNLPGQGSTGMPLREALARSGKPSMPGDTHGRMPLTAGQLPAGGPSEPTATTGR